MLCWVSHFFVELSIVMLVVVLSIVVMLNVVFCIVKLSVGILDVILLSVSFSIVVLVIVLLSVIMLSVEFVKCCAECCFAGHHSDKRRYAECRYAGCRYAERYGAHFYVVIRGLANWEAFSIPFLFFRERDDLTRVEQLTLMVGYQHHQYINSVNPSLPLEWSPLLKVLLG